MALQTTKPNIPTKDKNSADPDIRKFRDSEVNAIVASFQQVDDNFDEVEQELNNIAEPDLDQFIEVGGRYTLATDKVYTAGTTMLFDVARQYGMNSDTLNAEHNVPRYYFLGISKTGARDGNQSVIYHSSLVSPEILTPNKPTSPLPIYAGLTNPTSPLSTYANQAAMTADFANQVLDSYYYFTGNNGAYKYNGTATDSIDNYVRELYMLGDQSAQVTDSYYEYTGSTSMWQKTAASTGAIGDYTELVEVVGWEEWGTKPEWLIITGDAYLEGLDNLNKMTGTFYRRYDDLGTTLFDVVVLNIEAFTGGNLDADRQNAAYIVNSQFNGNFTPSAINDTFENDVIYNVPDPENIKVYMPLNPEDAFFNDLTGGNYSIQGGNNASGSLRSRIEVLLSNSFFRFFAANKITIIVRWRIRSTTTTPDTDRMIAGNLDGTDGFRFFYQHSVENIRFQVQNTTVGTASNTTVFKTFDDFICMAVTYNATTGDVKFYTKSTPKGIAFSNITSTTIAGKTLVSERNIIRFDRLNVTSTVPNETDRDYTYIIMDELSSVAIDTLMVE